MAALGWQFVWTYQFGLLLGAEMVAVLAVMAAFLGGLSLGSFAFQSILSRSARPTHWFIVSECTIAVWGLLVVYSLPHIGPGISTLISTEPSTAWHWTVAFVVPFFFLLPASVAMGLTIPAMELRHREFLKKLYSFNTFGAVLGVLLIVFFLVPQFGMEASAWGCALANLSSALFASFLASQEHDKTKRPSLVFTMPRTGPTPSPHGPRLAALLLLTGFFGVGYEVLVVRVLSQVNENTVFSYALVLVVYLLGTAAGSYGSMTNKNHHASPARSLQSGLAILILVMTLSAIGLWWADVLVEHSTSLFADFSGKRMQTLAPVFGEFFVAFVTLFLPSACMARVFTHLCVLSKNQAELSVGRAFAFNTLGAALAPLVFAVVLYPHLGAGYCLAAVIGGYIALTLLAPATLSNSALSQSRKANTGLNGLSSLLRPRLAFTVLTSLSLVALLSLATQRPLRFVTIPEGGRLVMHKEGVIASVSVVRDQLGVDRLHINNREQEGSSAQSAIETKLGLIPILLHPAPGRALFLGYGTGFTASTAARDASLKVSAVELIPEVIEASKYFQNNSPQSAMKNLKLINADGRRFIQSGQEQYDVIVADLFHPARNGAGALYTLEHFEHIKKRLAPEGIFCQWLALHQMELSTLKSIVASYLKVFPNSVAVLASNSLDTPVLGLVSKVNAKPGEALFDLERIEERLRKFSAPQLLKQAKLESGVALIGTLVADSTSLAAWANEQAPNTDDHPIVIHEAPWATYHPTSTPRARLLAFLERTKPPSDTIFIGNGGAEFQGLMAYWQAREKHLRLGTKVRAELDPEKMLNQIQVPLLEILSSSPNFQPAFDPLLALASALVPSNRPRANEVFQALKAIRPDDVQLAQAIAELTQVAKLDH